MRPPVWPLFVMTLASLGVGGLVPRSNTFPSATGVIHGRVLASDADNALRNALKSKYPFLTCKQSEVGNKVGGRFDQERCFIESGNAALVLQRYVVDLNTSTLSLVSSAKLQHDLQESKRKADNPLKPREHARGSAKRKVKKLARGTAKR